MTTRYNTIGEFITAEETAYKQPIPITDSWRWSMYEHIKLSMLYKNSQLSTGKDDFKPVKNITRPILNLQYRAEGFDVKDITVFADDAKDYFKSFLIGKFHEKWARENQMDTVIDAMVESYIDYGGALLKNVNDKKPEVVNLMSIAFCDQTDILSGPIGLVHFFSPDQLLEMATKGWGNTNKGATATLEETILLSREEKKDEKTGQAAKTPGKYIKVYEVHGNLQKNFLTDGDISETYISQMQIVAPYQKKNSNEMGFVILYRAAEKKSPFKFIARDAIYGRALGFGGAEELFEAQVWTNYDMIRIQDMLDAAAKTILAYRGAGLANKQKIRDMENMEMIDLGTDGQLQQVDTFPRNMQLFDRSVADWAQHAKDMGSAQDPLQGKEPTAGTPFASLQAQIQQGGGLHEYRQGKLATFWDEVEMDWIIPYLAKEIVQEQEFLAELSLDELQYVGDALVQCEEAKMQKNYVLANAGQAATPEMVQAYNEIVMKQFKKKGTKHFIQILQGEMKDISLTVRTNVAGKQKDLANRVEKLSNVFRTILSNPYMLQSPPIAKLFNQIVEASGLDPIDLSNFNVPPLPARRMTMNIDEKDLQPNDQAAMLKLAGIDSSQGQSQPAQPQPAKY